MTTEFEITDTLDVTGLNCPLPVVKTKQAVDDLSGEGVIEVRATDPGSVSDIGGWAEGTPGIEILDQVQAETADGTVYTHYVRAAAR